MDFKPLAEIDKEKQKTKEPDLREALERVDLKFKIAPEEKKQEVINKIMEEGVNGVIKALEYVDPKYSKADPDTKFTIAKKLYENTLPWYKKLTGMMFKEGEDEVEKTNYILEQQAKSILPNLKPEQQKIIQDLLNKKQYEALLGELTKINPDFGKAFGGAYGVKESTLDPATAAVGGAYGGWLAGGLKGAATGAISAVADEPLQGGLFNVYEKSIGKDIPAVVKFPLDFLAGAFTGFLSEGIRHIATGVIKKAITKAVGKGEKAILKAVESPETLTKEEFNGVKKSIIKNIDENTPEAVEAKKAVAKLTPEEWKQKVAEITQNVREKQPPKQPIEDVVDDISDIRPEPTPKEKIAEQIKKVREEQLKTAEGKPVSPEIDLQKNTLTDEEDNLLFGGLHPDAVKKASKQLAKTLQQKAEEARARGEHVKADNLYKLADILGAGESVNKIDDISPFSKPFYFPETLAEKYKNKYPEVKRIIDANLEREQTTHRYVNKFNKLIFDRLDKISDDEKTKLFRLLYRESFDGKPASKEEIASLSRDGRRLYTTIRRTLQNVWQEYISDVKDTIIKNIETRVKDKAVRKTFKEVLNGGDIKKIESLEEDYPEIVSMIKELREMKGVPFYMPQKRLGKYFVRVFDPEGDFRYTASFKTAAEAEQFAKRVEENPKYIENWFKEIGVDVPKNVDFSRLKVKAEEESQPLTQWKQDINFPKIIGLLDAFAKKKGEKSEFYKALGEDLINWMKSMGWSAHTIKRKNIPGFSLNPEENIEMLKSYLYGFGFAKTKKAAAEKQWKEFYKLASKSSTPAEIVDYLREYLAKTHASADSKAVRDITKGISSWYLAFRLKSAINNAFQNITTGMAAYINHGIKPTRLIDAWAKIFGKRKLSFTEKKALVRAIEDGELEAQILKEQLDNWRLEKIKKGKLKPDDLLDLGMYPFSFVESYVNRMAHFLGAFNHFRNKGLPFDEAYKKAIEVMHEGHYWASRYNKLPLQDANAITKVATALQTFTFHYFDQLAKYYKTNKKAFVYLIGSPMVLGGLVAIPGGDLVINHVIKPVYRKLTGGKELEWDLSKNNKGYYLKYGLFGKISPSLSKSIGVGFSDDPSKMFGGALQGILKQGTRAYKALERGDIEKAIIEAMPPAVRDVLRAAMFKKRGVETSKGIKLRDEKGRVLKPGVKETLMLSLGLQPPKYQKVWDKRSAIYEAQKARNEVLQRIVTVYRNGDKEKAIKLRDEWNNNVKEHYKKAKDITEKAYWRGMFIDNRSIMSSLRGYNREVLGANKYFQTILRK